MFLCVCCVRIWGLGEDDYTIYMCIIIISHKDRKWKKKISILMYVIVFGGKNQNSNKPHKRDIYYFSILSFHSVDLLYY